MTALAPDTAAGGSPRYRFVVRSAEEAVTVIREKLGESARVVSVRQVEGVGLSRFLSSPKLEVTAEVPGSPTAEVEASLAPQEDVPFSGYLGDVADLNVSAELDVAASPVAPPVATTVDQAYGRVAAERERAEIDTTRVPTHVRTAFRARAAEPGDPDRLWNVLDRAGLGWSLLAQMKEQPAWRDLATMPLSAALPRAGLLLRDTLAKAPVRSLTGRVGFFGPAGSGATTALCKQLVREVFFRQKSVCVMKVEGNRSNPSEGLAAFCEALSVPLLRSAKELAEVAAGVKVYFDLPSLTLGAEGNAELKNIFDEYGITSRVLVVNAAYDVDLIKATISHGDLLRSRHTVYSHLDELLRWGKLWEFVADARRTTLFASTGQNLAGDCVRDVVDLLTQKTLQTLHN